MKILFFGIAFSVVTVIIIFLSPSIYWHRSFETNIPLATHAQLEKLPGSIIYRDLKYTPGTGRTELLTTPQIQEYNASSPKNPLISPNQQYQIILGYRIGEKLPSPPSLKRFALPGQEIIYNLKTNRYQLLVKDLQHDIDEITYIKGISWSPDSRYLVYPLKYESPEDDSERGEYVVIQEIETGKAYRLFKELQPYNLSYLWIQDS
ncbi:MAG: hypothetical protein IPK79_08015 [Vampirovibrionales bacterium]|nr:hypothetical protein [Vampirovibrionales bacterium]